MESLFVKALSHALSEVGKAGIVLKPEQLKAVRHMYDGRDVFLWLPTGFGKSICFEVLPFLFDYKLSRSKPRSVVIVVSPLVSLMMDQVRSLRSRGVSAAIMSGHKDIDKALLATDRDVDAGKYSLLFSAPEAIIGSEKWREMLLRPPLSEQVVAVAIDEAHCVSKWSDSFRPTYARLHEIRALVPSGVPLLAATATVTRAVRDDIIDKLDMIGCDVVCISPNWPNTYYEVRPRTTMEADMEHLVRSLRAYGNKAERVIVYCRSLDMCSDLYDHFHLSLGDSSYYPPGSVQVSDNRLFGMYHVGTPSHNKEVILQSMQKEDGVVRVVFATTALGMGVNFLFLNTTYHYGAPRSIDDFFQESGRAGRSGAQAKSVVYWKPSDAPLKRDLTNPRDAELAVVRKYLENNTTCRRFQLLHYFDPEFACSLPRRDRWLCCDVCAATLIPELIAGSYNCTRSESNAKHSYLFDPIL